jgi:hypothetical protein
MDHLYRGEMDQGFYVFFISDMPTRKVRQIIHQILITTKKQQIMKMNVWGAKKTTGRLKTRRLDKMYYLGPLDAGRMYYVYRFVPTMWKTWSQEKILIISLLFIPVQLSSPHWSISPTQWRRDGLLHIRIYYFFTYVQKNAFMFCYVYK